MTNHTPITAGVDMSDQSSVVCILDEDGAELERSKIRNTKRSFARYFGAKSRMRVALEVGTHSEWASRVIEEQGHEVLVGNPRKMQAVYASDDKCDDVDAEMIARLARVDPKLLSPIRHRSHRTRRARVVLAARDVLVECRTRLINSVRGLVKSSGHRLPSCSSASFHKQADHLPEDLHEVLAPVMNQVAALTGSIRSYDAQVEEHCQQQFSETKLLRQIPGVGPVTSLAFITTIEDPHRFRRNRDVGSYLGLRPRRDQSGLQDHQLRITKAGDVRLRRLLVSCAHYILGPFGKDSDLRRWGLRLCERGGKSARKRAVVAVARKLSVLMLSLWKSGEEYEPLRNTRKAGSQESVNVASLPPELRDLRTLVNPS